MIQIKQIVCASTGFVGSFIASFFGGWCTSINTLIGFMIVDYMSGLIVAAVFKASKKTETGALESGACWKGIFRKIMTLVLVAVAYRLDLLIGASYIRDTITIAFIASEGISILENAGLMGLPIPDVLINAVDVLKDKVEKK